MNNTTFSPDTKPISLIEWFNGTPELLKLGFTENEIQKAILDSGNDINSLTEIKGFQSFPSYFKRAEISQESGYKYFVEEYDRTGQYSRNVWKTGIGVRVPAQYQGLKHGDILFSLLSNKFEWFTSFSKTESKTEKISLASLPINEIPEEYYNLTALELKHKYIDNPITKNKSLWTLYEVRNNPEIYLETSAGSLYVPISALINHNFHEIEERMISYATSYHDPINLSGFALNHRGRSKEEYREDKINDYNKMIAPLATPEAIKLKKYLS